MLEPLKHFICDTCGRVIEDPADGVVEWLEGTNSEGRYIASQFRIEHRASPMSNDLSVCMHHRHSSADCDVDLDLYLETAQAQLYCLLSPFSYEDPRGTGISLIADYYKYAEFLRRVTIPYYEEARQYFPQMEQNGEMRENSEILFFSEENLKRIIEKYGPEE